MKIHDGTARFKKRAMGMKMGAMFTLFGSPTTWTPIVSIDPFDLLKTGKAKEMVGFLHLSLAMETVGRIEKMDNLIEDRT